MNAPIVVDANLFLSQALPLPYSFQAAARLGIWRTELVHLFAPLLWEYEIVSGLRRAVSVSLLTSQEAESALETLLDLGVEMVSPTLSLHRRALHWAARLEHNQAYDPQYLALAEELGAVFWTADQPLVNKVRALGVDWIFSVVNQD